MKFYAFAAVSLLALGVGALFGLVLAVAQDGGGDPIYVTATPEPQTPAPLVNAAVLTYVQDCFQGLCIGALPEVVARGKYEPIEGLIYEWEMLTFKNGRPILIACTPAPVVCGEAEAMFATGYSVPFGIDATRTPNPLPSTTPEGYAPIESTVDFRTPLPTSDGS